MNNTRQTIYINVLVIAVINKINKNLEFKIGALNFLLKKDLVMFINKIILCKNMMNLETLST